MPNFSMAMLVFGMLYDNCNAIKLLLERRQYPGARSWRLSVLPHQP
jgi:hypothetical protein